MPATTLPWASPVPTALPKAAVPEGKGEQAVEADTKRRETVSSEGQKACNPYTQSGMESLDQLFLSF